MIRLNVQETEIDGAMLDNWNARIDEEQQKSRAAVSDFVIGVETGDLRRIMSTLGSLDYGEISGGGWRRAMIKVSRLRNVPDTVRAFWLSVWLENGDHIRQETGNDHALAGGLRALLPPYTGPAVRLYRGDSAWNRRRRTYGLSWSSDKVVAESFALGDIWRSHQGGSVLLETLAPPESIICASDDFGESEYLVDRRLLRGVTVLSRHAYLAIGRDRTGNV